MNICYLGNAANPHLFKWANHFAKAGHRVTVLSFESGTQLRADVVQFQLEARFAPLRYFLGAEQLKTAVRQLMPHVLHVHYASGYGTLARIAGLHPSILSAWGSDVCEFPQRGPLHARLLRKNFRAADCVCATGESLAREVARYTEKRVHVTPFGVDCEQFYPAKRPLSEPEFVIGIVKSLQPYSGMEYVLEAVAILIRREPNYKIRLEVVGTGPEEARYREMAINLGIADYVSFLGALPHAYIPECMRRFSAYLSLPTAESFGVALLEASASGLPVVASNIGGVPEVVLEGTTGFLVPPRDPHSAATAVHALIRSPEVRMQMGRDGREWVINNFEWSKSAQILERIYVAVAASGGRTTIAANGHLGN